MKHEVGDLIELSEDTLGQYICRKFLTGVYLIVRIEELDDGDEWVYIVDRNCHAGRFSSNRIHSKRFNPAKQ